MRREIENNFVEQLREMLIISDALGYSDTSLHLNAALITLDGAGLAPAEGTLGASSRIGERTAPPLGSAVPH